MTTDVLILALAIAAAGAIVLAVRLLAVYDNLKTARYLNAVYKKQIDSLLEELDARKKHAWPTPTDARITDADSG